MERIWLVLVALLAIHGPSKCWGHGNPVTITAPSAGQPLVVSGGQADVGYATMFFDHHPDAFLDVFDANVLGTDLPGFSATGLAGGTQLFLEVLPRPDFTDVARPARWLWYWNPGSGDVEVESHEPLLEIVDENDIYHLSLTQFDPPSPGPSVRVPAVGQHSHVMNFLLHAEDPNEGVYGFFARMTSPTYGPSQPFLIALNHGLTHGEFLAGARRINDSAGLPGDYDLDGDVAGTDFLRWQSSLGSSQLAADGSLNGVVDAADLTVWNANYSRVAEVAALAAVRHIPEPATVILSLLPVLALFGRHGRIRD